MYRDLRDVGLTWITICAWCDDPDEHGGKRISAYKWAIANAPFGKRWLDEHAEFARAWDHFVVCWKWAQGTEYAPERHPSLSTARDLMDTKKRAETYHSASSTTRTPVCVVRGPERYNGGAKDEQLVVSPATTIFRGEVEDMMHKHVPDASINLITADPPYFMRVPAEENHIDFWNKRYGMTPRFRADWDRFICSLRTKNSPRVGCGRG